MKATSYSSSISANLGNYGEAMVKIHKYSDNLWPPHFRTFCELVEGEENKLTTFSTWTIMLWCNESNVIFQQHLCKLGQLRRSNVRNSQVFGQASNLWPPHFCTFCELVEREENKLTTFSTWTIMLGCNESNVIFQQHLCKLGQLRRSNVRNSRQASNLWPPHFCTFCELVEGEENKLTTFSTWTIMLGCNESNVIFQQHLCKLGQLRRSNGKNSQVFGQASNLWPPHFCTFCELVEGEENKLTTFSTWTIMLWCNESNVIFQQHLCKLGQLRRSNGKNSQVFGQASNLWLPHFCTFCELVEGEENKLTTFSTWTIMLGCNESNVIFQQHLCKLGQLRRSNGKNSQVFGQASNLWPPHFCTFCELVEGEENKLTTFSTWTIMLGCNESNVIFQQHLCKLGQLRRSNGKNSQVFGQASNLWPPHFCTFCELVEGEENKLTIFSTWTIMLGCNESNVIFQQHLCKLGQLRRSNVRNSQVFGQASNLWPPHFCTFCEVVEGEENKLTTFSTWTIMLGCNESNVIFQQHLCKLGQLRRSNGKNSQVFGQASNLWPPHFCTFCELVEGEENKLTIFSTWTIMLGCNESNVIFQQHLCKLGQLRRSNVRNSQVFGQASNLWPPHFCTFCELVEGEENKLTTFSTWTIMLGCNESNVIFQQHLCKLGQLRRSNGKNSQVFGQASNLWPPHFCTFCELVEGEENKLTTFSTWTIMLGCNESNVIFQQHLCKLGQLRRSNGKNWHKYSDKQVIYGRHTFVLFVS